MAWKLYYVFLRQYHQGHIHIHLRQICQKCNLQMFWQFLGLSLFQKHGTALSSSTRVSDLVAWCKARPSLICFGVNFLFLTFYILWLDSSLGITVSNGFSLKPSKVSMPSKKRLRNRNRLSGRILTMCTWYIPCHMSVWTGVFFRSALNLNLNDIRTRSCNRLNSFCHRVILKELSRKWQNTSFFEAFVCNVLEMQKSD